MQRSSVVLPEPLGPMIATFSPARTDEIDLLEDVDLAEALGQADDLDKDSWRRLAGRPGRRSGEQRREILCRMRAGPDDVVVGVAVDADARILLRAAPDNPGC